VSKKKFINYLIEFLTAYKNTYFEASVKNLSLKYKNYKIHLIKTTKLWEHHNFIFSTKTVEIVWKFYDIWTSSIPIMCENFNIF